MLQESPHYRNDHDYASPALSSSHLDNPAFESTEYTYPASPNLPATPSYNGSYQNSPYTSFSDLEYDNGIVLLEDISHEYDPSDYDAPGTTSQNLLTFDADYIHPNGPQVSVSVAPPAMDHSNSYESAFDHSSPASSNGIPDAESDSRSRASSVSSHSHYPSSPPMEVTNGFESLRFDSPHWNSSHLPNDRPSPPAHKPPSPPSLVIPDSASSNNEIMNDRTPVINAPDGDGGLMNGPQLHIVPATPVSGGGVHAAQFMNNSLQGPSRPTWNTEATPQSNIFDHRAYPNQSTSHTSNIDHFLVPQQPRTRSKSDTATRPLPWELGSMESSPTQQRGGVNLNDILPSDGPQSQASGPASSSGAYRSSFNHSQSSHPPLLNNYHSYSGAGDSQYLSPEMAFGAQHLRRARSDGGRVGHRYSRSEGGISYPPSAHSDFIARTAAGPIGKQQFLHPTELLPSITRGHHRRSSSGSRDRGISGGSARHGLYSAPGSARASPYPSPSASPALTYEQLPPIPPIPVPGLGRGRPASLPAYGAASLGVPSGGISALEALPMDSDANDMNASSSNIVVSKPNVTTTATAEASERRRKTDANFVCPVPGCGSTFTRHFNLKGHLRSHNEEKPYQCKWPGCGKGFARAHDCKRHEQLHFNYRPHKCEGCGKSFQRMDALNRHLRSEGGQDCQKAQEEAQASGTITSTGFSSTDSSMTPGLDNGMSGYSSASMNPSSTMFGGGVKAEPDNWGMGVML